MSPHDDPRRALPSVDALLDVEQVDRYGHARVVHEARAALAAARGSTPTPDAAAVRADLARRLDRGVRRVVNATGVVLHTNLGRAPWSRRAIEAALAATAWCDVEFDRHAGGRGGRGAGVAGRLAALTGAEDALVVNNNAAAVLLALTALAEGRRVIVSRGELVEIGGGFRVPDVMAASGARLVEVGTTNRTHLRDYRAALEGDEPAAAILRVHPSNFRQVGFVTRPTHAELAGLGPPLLVDLGSGALTAVDDEPTIAEVLAAGAALVCVSGDKLLGGPQAGLVLGRADLVDRLRRHPLNRALRTGKVTLAALEGTLDAWLTDRDLPVRRIVEAPLDGLRAEVERWRAALPRGVDADVVEVEGAIGGGTTPGRTWPSWALAIRDPAPEGLRAALLRAEPPVVGRIHDGALLLDARTVAPMDDGDALLDALMEALGAVEADPTGNAR